MSDKIDVCVWCQECGTDLRFLLDRDGDGRLLISVYPCPVCEEANQRPAYRVCTRCYRRYPPEESPCPTCGNPEFALPGTECDSFAEFRYTWRFKRRLPERYGAKCRIVQRSTGPGPRNILVEFEDGLRVVTTWRAVKKVDNGKLPYETV